MNAYLTSIGEKTTEIAKEQLERYGFNVIVLGGEEKWYDKYKRFVFLAYENCIRIDADVIVNENIKEFQDFGDRFMIQQALTYDFYRNDLGITSPVYYTKGALRLIRKNWDKVSRDRPEASACRIPEINPFKFTNELIVGIHGFFQKGEDLERHKQHKIERKQMEQYDFELAEKLLKLL